MVVVPEHFPQEPGHQRTVPGVRQVVAVVGCVVLVDPHEVARWTLARYDDYPGVSARRSIHAATIKRTK